MMIMDEKQTVVVIDKCLPCCPTHHFVNNRIIIKSRLFGTEQFCY